mgnify:CR=1 FL=1
MKKAIYAGSFDPLTLGHRGTIKSIFPPNTATSFTFVELRERCSSSAARKTVSISWPSDSVLQLLDELEEVLDSSRAVPFSNKVSIDKEEIYDIISAAP